MDAPHEATSTLKPVRAAAFRRGACPMLLRAFQGLANLPAGPEKRSSRKPSRRSCMPYASPIGRAKSSWWREESLRALIGPFEVDTMSYKLTRYLVASEILPEGLGSSPSRLLFATRTGRSLRLRESVYQKLLAADFEGLTDATLLQLFNLELLVPQVEDEFQTILQRNRHDTDNQPGLSVTIQPTADCQLGCVYCGQKHSKVRASADVSQKITDRVISNLATSGRKQLSVQWFGAEPLMAYGEILKMSDRLIAYCQDHDVDYAAHMITNGMSLKPAVFIELLQRKIRHFQITLDGTAETHDILRITKEGERSFDIILRNIVAVTALPEFTDNQCGIAIRVNVNKVSALRLPQLIDQLSSLGLHERGVVLDFEPVVDWGGNGASSNSFRRDEFARQEIDWILHAIRRGFPMRHILPRRRTQPCMVVEKDGEVYDAFGNIFPCYEFPYTPAFEGPEYTIGHLDTVAHTKNDTPVTRTWFTDVEGDLAPCKHCNLFPVCGGGCPKQWYQGDVACPSFKSNIEDRLVLHFLRRKTDFERTVAALQA
jgi:uncharacterized protein